MLQYVGGYRYLWYARIARRPAVLQLVSAVAAVVVALPLQL